MDKQNAVGIVKKQQDMLLRVNDQIWQFAEMAFREYKSADLLCRILEDEGFTVNRGIAGLETAFFGKYGHGHPVIGILGEFDALSGMNQKGESALREPCSPQAAGQPGHGCGHNSFAAGSLAAAIAIKEYLKSNPGKQGTVVFCGCPGEEGGSGKAFMAREGAFSDLDAALTWHPFSANVVHSGSKLANVSVLYSFKGRSSHASSSPHLGRSALDAVELMNVGVQFLREHMPSHDRVHYAITDTGGTSPNVVQSEASVLYLLRSPYNDGVQELRRRVDLIANGAAMMTETEVSIRFIKGCSNFMTNHVLEKVLQQNMESIALPQYTEREIDFCRKLVESLPSGWKDPLSEPGRAGFSAYKAMRKQANPYINDFILPLEPHDAVAFGSSDVGDVSWNCPTAWLYTTLYPVGTVPHSWQWVSSGTSSIAHKGLLFAGEVLAGAGIDLIDNPILVAQAKEELQDRLNGHPYQCPIPPLVKPTVL